MSLSNKLKQRVFRYISQSSDLKWLEGVVDFDNQTFSVNGVKPLVQLQDDIESAFVWCWSIKDALISELVNINPSISRKTLEDEIDRYRCLTYCADIANGLKHNGLNRSRSGEFARLSVVQSILINPELISSIHRLDGKYFIVPNNTDCVKIKTSVDDANGRFLLDAYVCLYDSLAAWDCIYEKYK